MAQLRDAKTSELLAEGSPLEVALAAKQLGKSEVVGIDEEPKAPTDVIFDDVGLGFDPAAVIANHEENLEGLAAASKDPKLDKDVRASVKQSLAERKSEADVSKLVGQAGEKMRKARDRASK